MFSGAGRTDLLLDTRQPDVLRGRSVNPVTISRNLTPSAVTTVVCVWHSYGIQEQVFTYLERCSCCHGFRISIDLYQFLAELIVTVFSASSYQTHCPVSRAFSFCSPCRRYPCYPLTAFFVTCIHVVCPYFRIQKSLRRRN